MPDWFYRTVSQPILFRLPASRSRDMALGFMGGLARLPLGLAVIDFLGHMRADDRLRQSFLGIDFPTAVGLGPWLDPRATALPALAQFGFGFLEMGPVTATGSAGDGGPERLAEQQALWLGSHPETLALDKASRCLKELSRIDLPVIVRLGFPIAAPLERINEECRRMIDELAPQAQIFSLATLELALAEVWPTEQWTAHVASILNTASNTSPPRPVLLCVTAGMDTGLIASSIEAALAAGVQGLIVDGRLIADSGEQLVGLPAREQALRQVASLREQCGNELFVIAAGGIHEPGHALALRAAGADLVQIDSGLVFTGPGLPKRINDAFLFDVTRPAPFLDRSKPSRPSELTWFWTCLMGAGMFFGSLLALVIAATRVVLPYDEAFVGSSREGLSAINPRLLSFMAHDRISLAGTMIAIGVMYVGLSLFGIRRGLHWAQRTVFVSAFTGFATFFFFLGFGYLDTFHAFVTGALLQLLLLGVHARLGIYVPKQPPDLSSDWKWRWSLWGQLLLVIHGFALLAAGATISAVGITQVFVHEDLQFMHTTAAELIAANARLVPLVAHDRATFGGMLLSSGWVFLLPALWGFRRGSSWLWWTLLISGLSAYTAALGVHFVVGYLSLKHLLPAFAGLALFLLGMFLSYPFLCRKV